VGAAAGHWLVASRRTAAASIIALSHGAHLSQAEVIVFFFLVDEYRKRKATSGEQRENNKCVVVTAAL